MLLRYEYTLDEHVNDALWAHDRASPPTHRARSEYLVGLAVVGSFLFLLAAVICEFVLRGVRAALAGYGVEFMAGDVGWLHPFRVTAVLVGLAFAAFLIVAALREPLPGTPAQRRKMVQVVRQQLLDRYGADTVSMTVELDDDGIHVRGFGIRTSYDWANLVAIRQGQDAVLVLLRYQYEVVVPNRAFVDSAHQESFVRLIEGRLRQQRAQEASAEVDRAGG